MVIISEEVQDVLRSIYLHEIADGKVDTPSFWKCVNTLMKLDKPLYGYLRKPPRYSSWARGGMLMTSVCGYDFGFYWNEEEEFIDIVEVYKRINESKTINLSRSDMRMIVESVVYEALRQGVYKQPLCEKYYNPLREPIVDGYLNGYDILDGAKEEQILCDFPEKGWVEDIRMYSMMRKGGKTYCLFRRIDNGKYFFIEVYDEPCDKEYLHGKAVSKKDVPDFIWNDAVSLTRYS